MTPLVTIQLMGLKYQRKLQRTELPEEGPDEILEYDVSPYLNREVTSHG